MPLPAKDESPVEMRLPAPMGDGVRWITIGCMALLAVASVSLRLSGVSAEQPWVSLSVNLGFGGLLVVLYGFAATAYELTAHELRIVRLWGPLRIPRAEIVHMQYLPDKTWRQTLRLAGNGGLFGVYGRFRHKEYGHLRIWARRHRPWLLIRLRDGRQYVISTDYPRALFQALNLPEVEG